MSKALPGLAKLAFASTALVIPACARSGAPPVHSPPSGTSSDTTAPSVTSAVVEDGVLTLQFSEPVVAPKDFDPGKFRLTFGYNGKGNSYSDYYYASPGVARTWYTDIGRFSGETRLRQPAADKIQIVLPPDFNANWVCADLAASAKRGDEAGLFLHYSESTGPAIADQGGNRLQSIAAYWVTTGTMSVKGRANKPISVRIDCK
jgi:hypothetical protein